MSSKQYEMIIDNKKCLLSCQSALPGWSYCLLKSLTNYKPTPVQAASNNQVCSVLRGRYGLNVEVRGEMGDCDFIVNTATVVLRVTLTGNTQLV